MRGRNVKPALAISTQWPSKVVAPRYPSSILAKPPVPPCLDQDFWKQFAFNYWPSSFCGRKMWSVHTLCWHWKAVGIYTLPHASGKCDTLLLATKDFFVRKVNAVAESYKLPAQAGAGWSQGTVRCCATRAGDHTPVWTRAGLSHRSVRKCSHAVMQESGAAHMGFLHPEEKDAQGPAQRGWYNRNFPASGQECVITVPNTLILSVAILWVAEGLSHARGMCYKRAVLSEELQTCQQYMLKTAADMHFRRCTNQNCLGGCGQVLFLTHLPVGCHGLDAIVKTSLFTWFILGKAYDQEEISYAIAMRN